MLAERLPGCDAATLDGYLRGLGFLLLAGRLRPDTRASWDDDGVMHLRSTAGLDELTSALAAALLEDDQGLVRRVATPWRGQEGKGLGFSALREAAGDDELDWFDACALPREVQDAKTKLSDRASNPLLGQGGGFGRSDVGAAHEAAVEALRGEHKRPARLVAALLGALRAESLPSKEIPSIAKAAFSAYGPGRAAGPGMSIRDVEATSQRVRASAWDVVLLTEALRAFRGAVTRGPDPGAVAHASYPLLVRSTPVGVENAQLREDDDAGFELLAPIWSAPARASTIRHLIARARLRTPRGVARSSLEAALAQAHRTAHGLGFDRLMRFAFLPGSDPRYRYAVGRGALYARGADIARVALDEIVVRFLRPLSTSTPRAALHRRRLEDRLVALARPGRVDARSAQEALIELAHLETALASELEGKAAPRLSRAWWSAVDDSSPELRVARALVTARRLGSDGWLRGALRAQRRGDKGWMLDRAAGVPGVDQVGDPLRLVLEAALGPLRATPVAHEPTVNVAGAGLADNPGARGIRGEVLRDLLAGSLDENRIARLAVGLAALPPYDSPWSDGPYDASLTIGGDAARLILAARPTPAGLPLDPVERASAVEASDRRLAPRLAALVLAERLPEARIAADRELRRRRLPLLPAPPSQSPPPAPAVPLALALLLAIDPGTVRALVDAVSVSTDPPEARR